MVDGFVGRAGELGRLDTLLRRVGDARRDLPGVAVLLRGRRRVGKSRLVEVVCDRAGVPAVYFQASQGADPAAERAAFAASVLDSDLPGRDLFDAGTVFPTWMSLFRQLAGYSRLRPSGSTGAAGAGSAEQADQALEAGDPAALQQHGVAVAEGA